MQRWCGKLRSLAVQSAQSRSSATASRRLIHSCPRPQRLQSAFSKCSSRHLLKADSPTYSFPFAFQWLRSRQAPLAVVQVRHVSSRERKKRRKPMTPVTSKVKKIKMKFYSSFKSRFRVMNDGNIRRWKEGKRHNAHLKSKKAKRRLRKPATVPVAYAKVMKKLNFCA